jgi:hypothetical protein
MGSSRSALLPLMTWLACSSAVERRRAGVAGFKAAHPRSNGFSIEFRLGVRW